MLIFGNNLLLEPLVQSVIDFDKGGNRFDESSRWVALSHYSSLLKPLSKDGNGLRNEAFADCSLLERRSEI